MITLSDIQEISEELDLILSDLSNIEDILLNNPKYKAILDWLEEHDIYSDADFLRNYERLEKELLDEQRPMRN